VERADGRRPDEPRPVSITPGFLPHAEGSALIEAGSTHVIAAASVASGVPRWLRGSGRGWVTAEYGMLPRSTTERTAREARVGRQSGRSLEIQRLIGRSLRAVADLEALGERTVTVDCDVLRADGGTRTAAITAGYVALRLAFEKLASEGTIASVPVREAVAAISVGVVGDALLLDLTYEEDSAADTDLNVVMTESSGFVEVQGTAERRPFTRDQLEAMLSLAESGIALLLAEQERALRTAEKGPS